MTLPAYILFPSDCLGQSGTPRPPRLVAGALGTGSIPDELSVILAVRFWTIHEDGVDLPSDKRSGRGVHYFLVQIVLGVDHISGL